MLKRKGVLTTYHGQLKSRSNSNMGSKTI